MASGCGVVLVYASICYSAIEAVGVDKSKSGLPGNGGKKDGDCEVARLALARMECKLNRIQSGLTIANGQLKWSLVICS